MNPLSLESFLTIRRSFDAPRDRVFRAWTERRAIEGWFKPMGSVTTVVQIDLRVGGNYVFEINGSDGGITRISGVYVEIVQPEKLVFTWVSEITDNQETLVTVEFIESTGKTDVILTHERFTSKSILSGHRSGWIFMLDILEQVLGQN